MSREWDRGKGYDDRYDDRDRDWERDRDYDRARSGHVRYREDEDEAYDERERGGHKRPKHNEQDDYFEEYSYDDRKPRRKLVPSEASEHIIFLGLDQDFTEADLQGFLLGAGGVLNSVTIIRDRATGLSKGFGFAEFASSEHANAFLAPRFPFIHVPPPASHGPAAYRAWQNALDSGTSLNQRRVKIDFSQSVAPGMKQTGSSLTQMNDATRDIGTAAAPVLLFRGLDPISAPEAIAAAMRHSAGVGRDGAKGMRRVLLIKDKMTKVSMGFAFVEFVDIESASTVFANAMSPQLHPTGFKISERPVAVSFAHPYSWQRVPDDVIKDEACIESTIAVGGVDGDWARYWDESSTLASLEFEVELPAPRGLASRGDRKKKQVSDIDADVAAFLGEITQQMTAASVMPVSDKPLTLSFSKPVAVASKPAPAAVVAAAPVLGFSMDDNEDGSDAKVGEKTEDPKAAAAKRVAPLIASKKVANNISKWTNVQAVLNPGAKPAAASQAEPALAAPSSLSTSAAGKAVAPLPKPSRSPKPVAVTEATPAAASRSASVADEEFEYSDPITVACYLCSRGLKSLDQLKRHIAESDLHKRNLKDSALRDVARAKAKTARDRASASASDQPKYRDRALERRAMHNQPDGPAPEAKSAQAKKRIEGPPPPPSPPPPALAPAQDENNMGNRLLKKMGWTDGIGLGTEGEGRVEPVQTAMFETGAGIGASKGKEITNFGQGYGGYVAAVKDSAKARFNQS